MFSRDPFSRRAFLQRSARLGAMAAALGLGVPLPRARAAGARRDNDHSSPIRAVDSASSTEFTGDMPDHAHEVLWNKDGYLRDRGGIPTVSARIPVAVVGGGIAGLSAAYFLRDRKPVLFEQAPQLGGNSKGEIQGGIATSIGAAYICVPEPGSLIAGLIDQLGLSATSRRESFDDTTVTYQGGLHDRFWDGATDPLRAGEFRAFHRELVRIREEAFPDIMLRPEGPKSLSREELLALDAITMRQWLDRTFPSVHPHIAEFVHLYCWSAFGVDAEELSAAQGLNFLASDTGGVIAFPGGNAAVAAAMHRKLKDEVGAENLKAGHLVIDITPTGEGVRICYEDPQRNLHTVIADACIVASPKFVAKRMIDALPAEQRTAMDRLHYRAYIVANARISGSLPSPGFNVFRLEGQAPEPPRIGDRNPRPFTDLCFAGWADHDRGDGAVITVYEPLALDGAHQFLFHPNAHDKHRDRIRSGLSSVLTALGVEESRLVGLRMTRWGHSVPAASVGMLGSGHLELAARPVAGRLFFANQDNWANPCAETSISAAYEAAAAARDILG